MKNGPVPKDSTKVITESKLINKWMPTDIVAKRGPEGKSMSAKELIKAGLFKEKDGDLFPTAKYDILKKTGGLKKYGL
jgi:hypothetical protein